MDRNGVEKKIYRHILKAVAYYNRDFEIGANFDDIVHHVKVLNKNLVPINNLSQKVSLALNNIHSVGLIEMDEDNQDFHLAYKEMPPKQKESSNQIKRVNFRGKTKGHKKYIVKNTKYDNESNEINRRGSESNISSETIAFDINNIKVDDKSRIIKKRNKIRNRRPTPFNSKENLVIDEEIEDKSIEDGKSIKVKYSESNCSGVEDKTVVKKEDPEKKPETINDNKLSN